MNKLFETVKHFFPKPTLILTDEISVNEPIVFVANHEKNYGPSVMQLFFPVKYHPWVIYKMLEKGECSRYIEETFFDERLGLPNWLSKAMGTILEPLLIRLMSISQPIPVYRNEPHRITETFRKSMSVLDKGENILIFPENPYADNYSDHVREFYKGFLYLAKLYSRKTGQGLLFCPVSINPRNRTVTVEKKSRFNHKNDFGKESERMRTHLMRQIAGLYHQPWSDQMLPRQHHLTISEEIVR